MSEEIGHEEIGEFFISVYRSTLLRLLDWEETADEDTLLAPIGKGYTVRLSLIPDLDNQSGEQDHSLALYEDRKRVFLLDRNEESLKGVAQTLGEKFMYTLFNKLWKVASFQASDAAPHLKEATLLLKNKLDQEDPF